ncbi:hypothetical protein [uncultured Algibacter sp.]|uniref:hypothetical protein n=1 Tax=uncultured Algibacter sp. TaxID=298659 RepID=UPI0032180D06
MKDSTEHATIDTKFVKAIDEIFHQNKELGIKPTNDSALAGLIYPSNRGIISSVRNKKKHIPHLALINLSKHFEVDMNYFYGDSPFQYKPPVVKNSSKTDNVVNNSGDNNNNVINHAGEGTFYNIDTAGLKSEKTIVETVEVNTMINKFISNIDRAYVEQFLKIISLIQSENKKLINRIEKQLDIKGQELECFRKSYREEMVVTRQELSDARTKLEKSQLREIELLRSLVPDSK